MLRSKILPSTLCYQGSAAQCSAAQQFFTHIVQSLKQVIDVGWLSLSAWYGGDDGDNSLHHIASSTETVLLVVDVPIYIPLRKREWEFIKNTPESSRVCFSDGQGDNKGWLVVWKVDRWLARNPTIFIIICWIVGTNDSSTKRLMFQVLFFFIISCKILCKKRFNLFSYLFL